MRWPWLLSEIKKLLLVTDFILVAVATSIRVEEL